MNKDILFSPFTLKGVELKNRIGVAPMTRMSSPADSIPRQDVLDFLVRRQKTAQLLFIQRQLLQIMRVPRGIPNSRGLLPNGRSTLGSRWSSIQQEALSVDANVSLRSHGMAGNKSSPSGDRAKPHCSKAE